MYVGLSDVTPSSGVMFCPNSRSIVEVLELAPLWTNLINDWTVINDKFLSLDLTEEELLLQASEAVATDSEDPDAVSSFPSMAPTQFVSVLSPVVLKGKRAVPIVIGKEAIDNGKVTVFDQFGTVKAPEPSLTGISGGNESSVPIPLRYIVGAPSEVVAEAVSSQNGSILKVSSGAGFEDFSTP